MRAQGFFTLLAVASQASAALVPRYPPDYCHADNCLRAIRGTEYLGRLFCSSTLDLQASTITVYTTDTLYTEGLTTVYTSTSTETISIVTGTSATTITPPPDARRFRRDEFDEPVDPTVFDKKVSNILKMCVTKEARITSACSCLLKTGQNYTTTETEWDYVIATVPTKSELYVPTSTTLVEAQVTYLPIIKNPGFDHPTDPLRHWMIPQLWCVSCTYEIASNEGSSTSPNALKINWVDGPTARFTQRITVEVRKTYKFSFQYKIGSASRGFPDIYLMYRFSNGQTAIFKELVTNEWQTVESIATYMEDHDTEVDILIEMWVIRGSLPATETFYYDSFKIWEVPKPEF